MDSRPLSHKSPPYLGELCLRWSLPKNIREAVIGDLEEAFHQKTQQLGSIQARYWYMRQAFLTMLTYLRRTQRGMMMFVLSILAFFGFTIMSFYMAGDLDMFVNVPSFLIVVPPALFITMAITSKSALTQGLKMMFDNQKTFTLPEMVAAERAYQTLGNVSLVTGFLGTVTGWIAIASNITAVNAQEAFGPAFAVSMLTIQYALIVKVPCYLIAQKIKLQIDLRKLSEQQGNEE